MKYIDLKDVTVEFALERVNQSIRKEIFNHLGMRKRKNYSQKQALKALENVTLKINENERVGLYGHNGSGKTTLLRTIAGIYPINKGSLDVQGEISTMLDITMGLSEEMTGYENIILRGRLLGKNRRIIDESINEIADFSELSEFLDLPLKTYSSGMKMRLAFTVATTLQPEILILDEWLSVGDEKFKKKADEKMKELINYSSILVIASHSLKVLKSTCNRIIYLEKGKIVRDEK